MKTALVALACLLSFGAFAQSNKYNSADELRGNGRIVRETRTLTDFDGVETKQFPAAITIEAGSNESSVDIRLDDNLRPFLRIDKENGTLKLSFEDPQGKPFWISSATINVVIKTPQLRRLKHGSNSDVLVTSLSGPSFDLVNEANGDVTLRGKTDRFNVVSAANGTVRAEELLTQTANVVTQANATLRINAQAVREVKSGHGQVINVARRAK